MLIYSHILTLFNKINLICVVFCVTFVTSKQTNKNKHNMKKYNLIKTRDGQRNGTVQSYFFGESESDVKMLSEIKSYMTSWLLSYNNSITDEELGELFDGFDGSLSYDVWSFSLEEKVID